MPLRRTSTLYVSLPITPSYCFRLNNSDHFSQSPDGSYHVLFVDQGSCFTDLYVVEFTPKSSRILGSVSRQFGAKDIDNVLYSHFVKKLAGKMSILPGSKQSIRLMDGCRRLKEMLSAAGKAAHTVYGLMEDEDYQLSMTRAEMEGLVADQIAQFRSLVQELRAIYPDSIDAIEMIGGGSRIPFMQQIVSEEIGKNLQFTVDSASCIAKGCALLGIADPARADWTLDVPSLPSTPADLEAMKRMQEIETALRARDDARVALGEARNALEELIDQTRRELSGKFASYLKEEEVNALLNAEDDWLWNAGESASLEELKEHRSQLEATLKERFSAFYEAKEQDRLKIERELEEESKKRELQSQSDDVKLPYSARMSRVEANKKEGTELFKEKNYEMAVQRYVMNNMRRMRRRCARWATAASSSISRRSRSRASRRWRSRCA